MIKMQTVNLCHKILIENRALLAIGLETMCINSDKKVHFGCILGLQKIEINGDRLSHLVEEICRYPNIQNDLIRAGCF